MSLSLKQTIRSYYGFQFFFSLLIWLPIFYEFQKRIGLSDQQIFSIQSIYYIAFCLLEIPTGMIADRFGYRLCLRAGAVLIAVSNLLPIFFQNYDGFLAHFLLIALSRSLISGASSAYLYDYLGSHGAAAEYKVIEGKARAYGLAGKVVFWAGVGALMSWQLTAPYWLTFFATALSAIFAWSLPKLEKNENVEAQLQEKRALPIAGLGRILLDTPVLVFLMAQGVAIFVLGRIVQVNLYQPILGSKAFDLVAYGWVMALMTIFEAIGSYYPGWFRKVMDDLNAVFILTFLMAVSLAAVPFSGQAGTLAALCLFALACGFSFPIQRQLLNDAIPDSRFRATILSIESILDRAVNAWVAALLGSSLAGGHLDSFLLLSAGITIAAMIVLFLGLRAFTAMRHVHPVKAAEKNL